MGIDIALIDLWIPILVSAIACFVASSIIWMALPHHKADIQALPDEDAFNGAVGGLGLKPGLYMFPNCQGTEGHKSEAFQARWKAGPWGTINVLGAQPSFGKNLAITFVEMLLISVIVAYLASTAMEDNAGGRDIARFMFTGAFLGYVLGGFSVDAFLGKPTRFVITGVFDSLVYAAVTAVVFVFLWPEAADIAAQLPVAP
ncbi:MAG: hypothetical protein ACI89L_001121 [Phycisphaerales bacterium]|jgi:hypothetical protein